MGAIHSTLTPHKSQQLKLITVFSLLRCTRKDQMDIIEQVIGKRKNITDLDEREVHQVLKSAIGGEE